MLLLGTLAFIALALMLEPSSDGCTLLGFRLPPCPLRYFTGVRCPFCGLTTGTVWIARGGFSAAWRSNLLSPVPVFAVFVEVAYLLGCRLIAARTVRVEIDSEPRRWLWVFTAAAVALSWIRNLSLK